MSSSDEERERPRKRKLSARDQQKMQVEKLMSNPEKPVAIPDGPKDWKPSEAPDFVRFYMGSSAGAGSEVFHVYRHLRHKETQRQEWISQQAEKEAMEREFQEKLEENKDAAEARTAKKRAKRLKRKQRQKEKKQGEVVQKQDGSEDSEEDQTHFVIGGR